MEDNTWKVSGRDVARLWKLAVHLVGKWEIIFTWSDSFNIIISTEFWFISSSYWITLFSKQILLILSCFVSEMNNFSAII